MKDYPKMMQILLAAAFLSAAATGLAGLISGPVWIIGIGCLGSIGILAAAGFLHFQFTDQLKRFLADLQQDPQRCSHTAGLIRPIAETILKTLEQNVQQTDQMQEDAQALHVKLQLLEKRKASIEEILDSIHDAVLVTDAQDRILTANPAAEELFAFSFEPESPRILQEVIRDASMVKRIEKTRTSRIPHVRQEMTFEGTGGLRTYDGIFSCIVDEQEQVTAVVSVLHDITREKEISQMKNDFVSHVSHELKTPLASINAYAEMLVDGEAEDADTIREFCTIIQGQAQRLNRLIEDILNISRIESGLIKVAKENHSIALVIRDAVEMIKSYAQEKNIAVHSQAPIIFDQAYVDRDMISQVVINLLSNAVKYTPANGEITVQSDVNEAEGIIRVSVSDTGVGIPPEDVDHVFDKFYRVEANKKCAKGTGLGLNLVRQIVETVHGGEVFVTSTVGEGSTFGFELPLAAEAVAAGAEN